MWHFKVSGASIPGNGDSSLKTLTCFWVSSCGRWVWFLRRAPSRPWCWAHRPRSPPFWLKQTTTSLIRTIRKRSGTRNLQPESRGFESLSRPMFLWHGMFVCYHSFFPSSALSFQCYADNLIKINLVCVAMAQLDQTKDTKWGGL